MDIVGYITTQEPVSGWTPDKKLALLARFCRARGYREMVDDGSGNLIPNPVTRKEFMNMDIENYVKSMFRTDAEREAREAIVVEEIDFDIGG